MAIYKQIFPTKNPLFEFYFSLWKLTIATMVMRPAYDSLTYEYFRIKFEWGGKELFHFRIFDSYHRVTNRLDGILQESQPITLLRLYKIRQQVNDEIKKVKKLAN